MDSRGANMLHTGGEDMLESAFLMLLGSAFLMLRLSSGGSFPKPLSEQEEKMYVDRWMAGDIEARNVLIEHNLRLVSHIIKKYYTQCGDMQEDGKSCRVIVPDGQLSLAIGKEGQNARLAAKLTGFKIDIKPESEAAEQ